MQMERFTTIKDWIAKVILLMLPTLAVCYFLLWNANQFYSVLHQQHTIQCIYLGMGMLSAAVIYVFRFRFLPLFLILGIGLYFIYKVIDLNAIGEFDAFFISIQFLVFSITFLAGWILGWGLLRPRFFPPILAVFFLLISIVLVSKRNELFAASATQSALVQYGLIIGPIIFYGIYIVFMAAQLRRATQYQNRYWQHMITRVVAFILLGAIAISTAIYWNKKEIEATLADFGGGAEKGEDGLLKKKEDGTYNVKQSTQLSGAQGRSNTLMFAAHIDNFFPDSETPNPLYLTTFYYSKFDTLTETFERDSLIPNSDLFEPNPEKIPLYFPLYDSSKIRTALQEKHKKTVEIEVYKKGLSTDAFVAPSTAFFMQPIAVEKDFKNEFTSAYRAKSYVSELNSAYFVYNDNDPIIQQFQQQRFDVLRQVKDYTLADAKLISYYTFMPKGATFKRIQSLSDSLTSGKRLPIDKVLAIRDYFTSKNANGEALFSYTDNPGIPDIPDASKLAYFLFESRKGYCAYYAGATLFLLRAQGIPARIAAGFLTVDRSTNNKGWYWFYADQAHAWVQVYFPGYGWLDFDTTVGNDDAAQSPTPDGTPPMQPPKAYLAAHGVVTAIDTNNKVVHINVDQMMYHDKQYTTRSVYPSMALDISIATLESDSNSISYREIMVGDSATAISFAESLKNLTVPEQAALPQVLTLLPSPAPIDELHIKHQQKKIADTDTTQVLLENNNNWNNVWWTIAAVLLLLIIATLALPKMLWFYFKNKATNNTDPKRKAYWSNKAASFLAHQHGYAITGKSTLQYSQYLDGYLATDYETFASAYLKLKYSNTPITDQESQVIQHFLNHFESQLKKAIPTKVRFKNNLKAWRALRYFNSKIA
jgi:hypothetical protein